MPHTFFVTLPASQQRLLEGTQKDPSHQTLLVIGAGPKAIAIAAKRAALKQLGYAVPNLIIIDKQGLVAHWSGDFGYTDGRQLLGTLPEKDVGFPYASTMWGGPAENKAVDHAMTTYSWQRYLINKGGYSDWIDRTRTRPTHREWSEYLSWVAERIELNVQVAEVLQIAHVDQQWQLSCRPLQGDGPLTLKGDGVVITGPGTPIKLPGQPDDSALVLDGASFWTHTEQFARLASATNTPVTIGVIGTGETAAAIVLTLLDLLKEKVFIEVVNPRGVLYVRDEGFEENSFFSDPDARWVGLTRKKSCAFEWTSLEEYHKREFRWTSLTEEDRREFLRRTDRGVFSVQAMTEINRASNVRSVIGSATRMQASSDAVLVDITYGGQTRRTQYDYLVVARGFDPLWFTNLLEDQTRERLRAETNGLEALTIERTIGRDLSLQSSMPGLHLPMLAGLAQGPGFPNLSCLGLLADRVLSAYVLPHAGHFDLERNKSAYVSHH